MRIIAERVVLALLDRLRVEHERFRNRDDDRVGREVAQPLAAPAAERKNSAQQIGGGKQVNRPQQVADDDLAELKFLGRRQSITRRRSRRFPNDCPRQRHSVNMP